MVVLVSKFVKVVHNGCIIPVPLCKMVYNGAPFFRAYFYQRCIYFIVYYLAYYLHCVKLCTIMYNYTPQYNIFDPQCTMVYLGFSRCARSIYLELESSLEWDAFKAKVLAKIDSVIKPAFLSFDNYSIKFTVLRVHPKPKNLEDIGSWQGVPVRAKIHAQPLLQNLSSRKRQIFHSPFAVPIYTDFL